MTDGSGAIMWLKVDNKRNQSNFLSRSVHYTVLIAITSEMGKSVELMWTAQILADSRFSITRYFRETEKDLRLLR